MKLLLVNIYSTDTIARYLYSSYVLKAYLDKTFLGAGELTVSVVNIGNKTPIVDICNKIEKINPDVIGYSCYIWNIEKIVDIVTMLKKKLKAKQILGGPEISVGRASFFSELSVGDYYVVGEGERKLAELIGYLVQNQTDGVRRIPAGVAYRGADSFHFLEDSGEINLNDVPSVYLTGTLDDDLYKRQQAFLETQRGCRFKCNYCVYHKDLPRIKYYPLQRVLDELDHLVVKKKVSALRIIDALFTSDLDRAKKIVGHLLDLKNLDGVRLPWIYWEFLYDSIDEEFCRLTAALKYRDNISNCNTAAPLDRSQIYSDLLRDYTAVSCVGIQSFFSESLRSVERPPIHNGKFRRFMSMFKNYNIALKADMILGLPFETLESYFHGLEYVLPYFEDTDFVLNIHRLQILPGSQLEAKCAKYGVSYSLNAPHTVFSTNDLPRKDMILASKVTAVLFRIINSPLRKHLYQAQSRTGSRFAAICEAVFRAVCQDMSEPRLVKDDDVDDNYWCNELYHDLPSDWLVRFLERYRG